LFLCELSKEDDSTKTADANDRERESQISLVRKRPNRSAAHAMKLDIGRLSYVRLPKAPMSWKEQARQNELAKRAPAHSVDEAGRAVQIRFAVFGEGWRVQREESLSPKDLPNPAYRQMFPTSGSTTWLAPKGRREDFPSALTVVMTINRSGAQDR
jgi:hypothetical protein